MTKLRHAFVAMTLATVFASANAATPTPLGMTIGTTSCADAMKRIGASKLEGGKAPGQGVAEAADPSAVYVGATNILAVCGEGKLVAVVMELSKGGMGNPAAREVFGTLSSKYKRIAGGAIPTVGDGYARFESDGVVVELKAPHLSFEFTLTYADKGLWERTERSKNQRADAEKKAKDNAL